MWFSLEFLFHCSWLISVWSAKHEGSVARLINMRNDRASVQQGARITMHHQRTKQAKIADSQRICDGSSGRRRRRQTILFNLNAATMYRLLSIFLFYLMFTTHDVVIAADNQPDGGGNNDVNDGFTVGPEAITTAFGEFISLFGSVCFFCFWEASAEEFSCSFSSGTNWNCVRPFRSNKMSRILLECNAAEKTNFVFFSFNSGCFIWGDARVNVIHSQLHTCHGKMFCVCLFVWTNAAEKAT